MAGVRGAAKGPGRHCRLGAGERSQEQIERGTTGLWFRAPASSVGETANSTWAEQAREQVERRNAERLRCGLTTRRVLYMAKDVLAAWGAWWTLGADASVFTYARWADPGPSVWRLVLLAAAAITLGTAALIGVVGAKSYEHNEFTIFRHRLCEIGPLPMHGTRSGSPRGLPRPLNSRPLFAVQPLHHTRARHATVSGGNSPCTATVYGTVGASSARAASRHPRGDPRGPDVPLGNMRSGISTRTAAALGNLAPAGWDVCSSRRCRRPHSNTEGRAPGPVACLSGRAVPAADRPGGFVSARCYTNPQDSDRS